MQKNMAIFAEFMKTFLLQMYNKHRKRDVQLIAHTFLLEKLVHIQINLFMLHQEQPQKKENNAESTYLDTVIGCITERNTSRIPIQDANINNLYSKANTMIKQFDNGISICKKYNEAKINRKYQIIIHDLQVQVKRLQESLKLQQDARSPTKKHVSDLLEKLVQLRSQKQSLKQENQELKQKIKTLNETLDTQTAALNKLQGIQAKGAVERLPPIGSTFSIAQGVKQFLKDKEQVRKIAKNQVTCLQRLLNQLKPKLWNWNISNLLQQIDKWSQGMKQKPSAEVDMWRIRSSIARKFSDCMDNPQNLTKPSTKFKSQQILWQKLQQKNHLHVSKFSYLGSKRSLNASFH